MMQFPGLNEAQVAAEIPQLFKGDLESNLKGRGKFSRYSQIYSFTTENISGYFPLLDWRGKRVLMPAGSGDQLINAYMLGASVGKLFDINVLSGFQVDAKLAGLDNLCPCCFKNYFMRGGHSELSPMVYARIRLGLHELTAMFFDKAYSAFDHDGHALRESALFNNLHDKAELKVRSNLYLHSMDSYAAARSLTKPAEWVECPVQDLDQRLGWGETFDIILLSNIADYAQHMFAGRPDYLSAYVREVVMPLRNHLAPGGLICAAYVYDAGRQHELPHSDLDVPARREAAFSICRNVRELMFDSVISGQKDAIVIVN